MSVARKPNSTGLLALNADGIHSTDVGVGPTVEDSVIGHTGDDVFNARDRAA